MELNIEVEREEDSDDLLQVFFLNDRYDHSVSDEELQYNIKQWEAQNVLLERAAIENLETILEYDQNFLK